MLWCYLKQWNLASFIDCVSVLANVLNLEDMEKFVIIVWAVWKEFCMLSPKPDLQLGMKIQYFKILSNVEWVLSFLDAFKKANEVGLLMLSATKQLWFWLESTSNESL